MNTGLRVRLSNKGDYFSRESTINITFKTVFKTVSCLKWIILDFAQKKHSASECFITSSLSVRYQHFVWGSFKNMWSLKFKLTACVFFVNYYSGNKLRANVLLLHNRKNKKNKQKENFHIHFRIGGVPSYVVCCVAVLIGIRWSIHNWSRKYKYCKCWSHQSMAASLLFWRDFSSWGASRLCELSLSLSSFVDLSRKMHWHWFCFDLAQRKMDTKRRDAAVWKTFSLLM